MTEMMPVLSCPFKKSAVQEGEVGGLYFLQS